MESILLLCGILIFLIQQLSDSSAVVSVQILTSRCLHLRGQRCAGVSE